VLKYKYFNPHLNFGVLVTLMITKEGSFATSAANNCSFCKASFFLEKITKSELVMA